jgi:hypothetical protein
MFWTTYSALQRVRNYPCEVLRTIRGLQAAWMSRRCGVADAETVMLSYQPFSGKPTSRRHVVRRLDFQPNEAPPRVTVCTKEVRRHIERCGLCQPPTPCPLLNEHNAGKRQTLTPIKVALDAQAHKPICPIERDGACPIERDGATSRVPACLRIGSTRRNAAPGFSPRQRKKRSDTSTQVSTVSRLVFDDRHSSSDSTRFGRKRTECGLRSDDDCASRLWRSRR